MVGKAQIVERVAAAGGTRAQAVLAVDAVLEAVTAELVAGERVTLTGFGTFEPVARPARTVRNPRTGGAVEVPASVAARFRPGAGLRAALAGSGARVVPVRSTPVGDDVASPIETKAASKAGAKPAQVRTAAATTSKPAASKPAASKPAAKKADAKVAAKAGSKSKPKAKSSSKDKKKKH